MAISNAQLSSRLAAVKHTEIAIIQNEEEKTKKKKKLNKIKQSRRGDGHDEN